MEFEVKGERVGLHRLWNIFWSSLVKIQNDMALCCTSSSHPKKPPRSTDKQCNSAGASILKNGREPALVHGIALRLSIKGFTAATFDLTSAGISTGNENLLRMEGQFLLLVTVDNEILRFILPIRQQKLTDLTMGPYQITERFFNGNYMDAV
uniref:Uncharacterized protein n=1 Tax=Salix viminalis TaxID=40686 RepID=A0A6N2MSY4_SALVM